MTNRKSSVLDGSVPAPMTLSDHERREAMGPTFPADIHTYMLVPCDTAIKFGMVTDAFEWRVLGIRSATPLYTAYMYRAVCQR